MYDRWIKSKLTFHSTIIFDCPFCFAPLSSKFTNIALGLPICNSIQSKIASEAWIEMGGNPNAFKYPHIEYSGIKCDDQGNIVALEWFGKRLNGKLSLKLGNLPQLEFLYA